MDDLQKRASENMPRGIQACLDQDKDLVEQLQSLSDDKLKVLSVTITTLVEHASLMADKPRQRARKQGDAIHAKIENDAVGPKKCPDGAKRTPLCATR
tara:strand:- start:9507 stop:9800 length:294 start_codon:yes stop_codon:yes gene_type:complete